MTESFNIKFVGEVEKHPELYDNRIPGYSRKDLTEKAWGEIGHEMNLSGKKVVYKFNIFKNTVVFILRGSFCTNL